VTDRDLTHDPRRDVELERTLRALDDEPPLHEVDWDALRAGIRTRAELPLARRRRAARARATPRWLRPLVPAALAAGIALTFVMRGGPGDAEDDAFDLLAVEQAVHADVSDPEFRLMITGMNDADELLAIAVDGP
jgi:hypothetical protein